MYDLFRMCVYMCVCTHEGAQVCVLEYGGQSVQILCTHSLSLRNRELPSVDHYVGEDAWTVLRGIYLSPSQH